MKKSLLTWATALAIVGALALPVMAGGGGGGGRGGMGGGGMGGGGMGGGGMGGGGMGGGGMGGGGMGGGGMGGGMGGGGMGGRAAVDPAAQVTNSMARVQTALGMTEGSDEWKVLSAKIQKVLQDQQKLNAGAQNPLQGGRGGGGGRGGAGAAAPAVDTTNPLAVARNDLSKAVMPPADGTAAPTTSEADLKTKMTAVRDNHKKLEETLVTDQKALQGVCTVRQEAILVVLGVLE